MYKEEMFSYIAGVLNTLGCEVITVGGYNDHIHALFCLCRTKSISDLVRDVKTKSSIWYKSKPHNEFMWQSGYGIFSVSQSNLDATKRYISNQEEHHKSRSFQDEYRLILNSYEVEYDEKYVWD